MESGRKIDWLQDECPVRAALDVIGGRWKPSILHALHQGRRRFSDLQREIQGVAAQVLTVQLRQLEADGIVSREVFAEIPPRVEYELSEFGKTLSGIMEQLGAWGEGYLAKRGSPRERRLQSLSATPAAQKVKTAAN